MKKLKEAKKGIVFLVHVHILIGLLTYGLVYASDPSLFPLTSEECFQITCKFFFVLVIWFFLSWYLLTDRLLDPYLIFLTSAILFNGGQVILEVFQLNKEGFLDNFFSSEQSLMGVYFVTLGLCAMHFGAILSVVFTKINYPQNNFLNAKSSNIPIHIVFRVGQILLYISILPTLVTLIDTVRIVMTGGYSSLYQQEQVTGLGASASIVANFIFPGAFLVIAGGQGKSYSRQFAVFFILLYTCTKLVVGSRGAAVMPLLAMLWLWDSSVRPLSKALLLVISLLLSVIFPLVGSTRNAQADLSIEFLIKSMTDIDNPIIASISEMGGSMKTVVWTMQLVPIVRPFALGMSYLVGILVIIPNVFSQGRHPALTMSGYDISDYWLVREIDAGFADRGGSFGFSFIAEAYLNFGWAGIVFLGLLGFLYGKFVDWGVRDRDPAKMAVIAIFVSFFLFYARGASEMIFRPFLWYSMLPYLWMKYLSSSNKNSE
jgi:oligosaccharide repeat unit polymerase